MAEDNTMATDDCLFCRIIAGDLPSEKIYEDDDVVAILDLYPVSPGHALVLPKKHTKDFISTDPELLSRVIAKVHKVAGQVTRAMNADGFNLATFNGRASGQEVFHLHFHIIPRKAGDRVHVGWPKIRYREGEMAKVAERIRNVDEG
ncbi:MAG: HIT family protein [Planctomycetes bacterium]|nr:HIT family protein [Planctomycetota bacterium]